MSYLEQRDISKVYGDGAAEVQALQRGDRSVEAGSSVAVVGASGSGKSRLLTLAGSLEDPGSGEASSPSGTRAPIPRPRPGSDGALLFSSP